jgi:hypothetical protein
MGPLFAKHIELIDGANNARTNDEHNIALAKLVGFREAMDCMTPRPLHLIECDLHYLAQGIDRPMCCGVWLDWEPQPKQIATASGER